MSARRAPSAALLLCALAGCDGGFGRGLSTVRDSAGVEIVESSGPIWGEGEGWRVTDAPTLDLAAAGPVTEPMNHQVVGATRLADGRIVVAEGASNELRFYGADGALQLALAGSADSTATFATITSVSRLPGDSLLLFDASTRRIVTVDPQGRIRGSATLAGESPPLEGALPLVDGSVLARSAFQTSGVGAGERGVIRPPVYFLRFRRDGALIDTVAAAPGSAIGAVPLGPAFAFMDPLLKPVTAHAVHEGDLYVGTGEVFEIAVLGADGLERLVRVPGVDLAVPADEVEAARAELRSVGRGNPMYERLMAQMERQLPDPTTRPAYADLLVDAPGNLWVGEYPRLGPGGFPPRTPRRWTVFDPEGRMLGVVEVPEGVRVLEVGEEYLLGARWSPTGSESVQLYGLVR